jgi:hypothetical protein
MANGLSDLLPGLREAEDSYRQASAEAFAGIEPKIAGMVDIAPFTPAMFIDLDGAQNAFFSPPGTPITPADVCAFLWRCSPYYTRTDPGADDIRRFFQANLYVVPYNQAVDDINAYVKRAWLGMPLWKTKVQPEGEKALAQWPARLVHMFAKEYGWLEAYTLNLPFRRLWQYANRILEEHDPKFKEQCSEVLRMRADLLTKLQAELDAAKREKGEG